MWVYDLLIIVLATEAFVNLCFYGAPLIPIREWLLRKTPFLTTSYGHLLECKYCLSVWVAGIFYMASPWITPLLVIFAIHRLANFIHLIFSYLRDVQFDRRIKRGL